MRQLIIKGKNIYTGNEVIESGFIHIDSGVIKNVGTESELNRFKQENVDILNLNDQYSIIPGMIDLHIHGANGADIMDGTTAAFETIAKSLPTEGTTSFLATTLTEKEERIKNLLLNLGKYIHNQSPGMSEIVGIHLEGPFISPKKPGAQSIENIMKPDIEKFQEFEKRSQDNILLVTMAPEEPGGLELVNYLCSKGIVASIGHSNATSFQVEKAVKVGVSHVTHLYNAMSPLHHREPGVVGSALTYDELLCELIVDGIHIHPDMVKLAFHAKGRKGLVLVTDAMRAKYLGEGTYTLGKQLVTVHNGKATLENGTLVGSVLTMKESIKNMINFTDCTLEDIVYMTAVNPAKQLNMFHKKGSLEIGKDADFVVLDDSMDVFMTFCKGKLAFKKGA